MQGSGRRRWPWLLVSFLVPLLLLALGTLGVWYQFAVFRQTPLNLPKGSDADEPFLFEIPLGMPLRTLAAELTALGVLDHPYFFLALAYLSGDAARVKAGEYEIRPGTTPGELLTKLVRNQVYQRSITLIEGWTVHQLLAALAQDDRLVHKLEDVTPEALMARLGRPDQSPEGRFFPDTYHFIKGASDQDVLQRALLAMERVLAEEWSHRAPDLPLTSPEQALILASIIEKETGQASERPLIAGVFIRRLQFGMRLQTDPTVIYGLGAAFDGDLRRADLLRDTPYNTYVRSGLPPTPIALPGRAAIRAALHPASGNSLYFVAKGDGGHWFSATLEEHNLAVRRYQLNGKDPVPRVETVAKRESLPAQPLAAPQAGPQRGEDILKPQAAAMPEQDDWVTPLPRVEPLESYDP